MTNRLWSLQGDRRQAVADELHTELNLFLGDFLHHLHREETETNALLWQHFTDAELVKLQGDLLSSISPVRFAEWMQIMLPSMNTRERAFLVGGMKQAVPQPMFEGFTNLAEQVLGEQAWTAVQERLLS